MIRTEPIIAVKDVEKSSSWYQSLFNCKGKHGGPAFEILADQDETVILCLHPWEAHGHPTMTEATPQPGNGLILYFRVNNLEEIWKNARQLKAPIEAPPHINQNSGKEEFSLRDLDGYCLTVSS